MARYLPDSFFNHTVRVLEKEIETSLTNKEREKCILKLLSYCLKNGNYDRGFYKDFIHLIIKDLEDKCEHNDIIYVGKGKYSYVFKIGDYILKLGVLRHCDVIKESKYILKPLLFKRFKEANLTIEVTREAMLIKRKRGSDKIVYSLFEKLLNDNILWWDCDVSNVGVLLSDNVDTYGDISELGRKYLGIFDYESDYLKKGDYVVIDLDHLYELPNKKVPTYEHEMLTYCLNMYEFKSGFKVRK